MSLAEKPTVGLPVTSFSWSSLDKISFFFKFFSWRISSCFRSFSCAPQRTQQKNVEEKDERTVTGKVPYWEALMFKRIDSLFTWSENRYKNSRLTSTNYTQFHLLICAFICSSNSSWVPMYTFFFTAESLLVKLWHAVEPNMHWHTMWLSLEHSTCLSPSAGQDCIYAHWPAFFSPWLPVA